MDQSRSQCPLSKKKDTVQKEEGKVKENKYDVKPPRDLRSKYLIKVNYVTLQFLLYSGPKLWKCKRNLVAFRKSWDVVSHFLTLFYS